jgi:hypothetical protein
MSTQPNDPGMLTPNELAAMQMTAELANLVMGLVIADGPTRQQDCAEFAQRVHAIQHTIMAQAAARAYPSEFRLLGGVV